MYRPFVIIVLFAWAPAGCPQPTADRRAEGNNASKQPPMRPKPRPMTPAAAGPRRRPGKKRATAGPTSDRLKLRKACLSLYRARITHLSALLAKVGLHRTQAQLVKDYGLNSDETLRACMELTPAQRRCVIALPNPLIAEQPCRLDVSLGLRAPPALMALLTPKPVAVDEATARHQLTSLRGRWVHESSAGRRTEIEIGPRGRATFRRFRDNRPQGGAIHSVLSIRRRRELLRRRAVTVQRYVYLRVNRNNFYLSGNPLHTATPIRNRTEFRLSLARDRVLRLAGGQCEVIDLGYLSGHAATCTWSPDAVGQVPVLRVTYLVGRWKLGARFFLVGAHLLDERLYQRHFVRR